MDPTQLVSGLMSSLGAQNTQGTQSTQGHHHHHKSMAQQVDSMSKAIDDAVKSGQLTDDQATAMKKELDDIKDKLAQVQGGSGTQLSADDRKKIGEEMHDVRKQLFDALNPQAAAGASATNQTDQLNNLFSAMDSNGDGNVSKDEFSAFLNNLAQNGQNSPNSMNMGYNQQGSFSMSFMQSSSLNITA